MTFAIRAPHIRCPESRALNEYDALSQKSLVDFLHADLDLCLRMLKTAHRASDPEHYHSTLERVRHGLQVIRNLADRIKHAESWKTVYERADLLERAMESLLDRIQSESPGKQHFAHFQAMPLSRDFPRET